MKGAYSLLYQACELYNNIAYNLAQLEIRLDEAIRYVTVAIMVMENLRVLDSHDRFFEPELFIYTEERLAQYYDTLAWIHFRLRDDAG